MKNHSHLPDWTKWLLPMPRGMEIAEGDMAITSNTRIVVVPEAGTLTWRGATQIRDDLKARRGLTLPIVPSSESGNDNIIAVGHSAENTAVRNMLASIPVPPAHPVRFTRVEPPAEGYLLHSSPDKCVITGADDAGCYYGIQTLRQIIRGTSGKSIPSLRLWDWPCFPVRAMHCMCPRRSNLRYYEKMIEALALWKINVLVLSFEYVPNFPFEGFPSLVDEKETLTRAEHAAFAQKCRDLGLQVIPLVPSFGHLEGFIFKDISFDDILEKPEDPIKDHRPFKSPRGNYCPSNLRTYEIYFDLFEQILDAYPSRLLHIGHDEIDDGPCGVCPTCKGVPLWQLLAEDLWRIYDYMTLQKGVRLMMWPDMIIPWFRGGPRDAQRIFKRKYMPPHMFMHFAVDHLPKDIIMTDWEYNYRSYYLQSEEVPEGSYPSLDYLLNHGFTVLPFGWNDPRSIMLFSQAAWRRSKLDWAKPGNGGSAHILAEHRHDVIGYAGCTWGHWGQEMSLNAKGHALTAAFAWNPNQTLAEMPDNPFQFLLDTMEWTE